MAEPRYRARVITVSTRAAAGIYDDTAGPLAARALADIGLTVDPVEVVPDGEPIAHALRRAIDDGVDCVITSGGTGLSPTDRTPEQTRQVLDFEVPGIADNLRASAWVDLPIASLSRGISGVAGRTLIVNLPGSIGGVRDAMAVLPGILPHALDQLHGGDHARHDSPSKNAEQSRGQVLRAAISPAAIAVGEHEDLVRGPDRGATVSFAGGVRDHDHGRAVVELEYLAHPSASEVLAEVTRHTAARPGVGAVAVSHRVGTLIVGDTALACAISAAHRQAAFAACGWLVDEIKAQLPIWKRQVFNDGTSEWVNCP